MGDMADWILYNGLVYPEDDSDWAEENALRAYDKQNYIKWKQNLPVSALKRRLHIEMEDWENQRLG